VFDLLFNLFEFAFGKREIIVLPLPVEGTLAIILFFVEHTARTNLVIDDSYRLEPV
jgi:hypothetical protein